MFKHTNRFKKIKRFAIIWMVGAMLAGCLATGLYYAGQWYRQSNTMTVYTVYLNQQIIGTVENIESVKDWLSKREQTYQAQYPDAKIKLDDKMVKWKQEKRYKPQFNPNDVYKNLENKVGYYAKAFEIKIDGKRLGIVKDEETAERLLEQLKEPYIRQVEQGPVEVLSVDHGENHTFGKIQLETSEFVQEVNINETQVEPMDLDNLDELIEMIRTGEVQPLKYTVQQGDTISEIAQQFNISQDLIYRNNPWIENDLLQIGDKLNLTVLQPLLSVKTVEKATETLEMPYGITYQEDENMLAGTSEMLVKGQEGLKKVTYEITKVNGELVNEEPVDEVIVKEPTNAVIKQGTKIIPGIGTGLFAWPVEKAKITSEFGKRWGSFHEGTDNVSSNKTIYAADNGKVISAGWNGGYGKCIVIDHQNGYQTLYAHMSQIGVKEGELVEKGQEIGIMGTTGNSTGVHLHFEISKDGEKENPLKYLNK